MPKKPSAIPTMRGIRLGKREASKGWQIVGEALWRNETNGIPARIAKVLDSERVNIARAQKLIMLGTLLAMCEVGEMLRASANCERLLNFLEDVGIGLHGAKSPNTPAHRRRVNDVRLSTETRSQRSVQPACSALSCFEPPEVKNISGDERNRDQQQSSMYSEDGPRSPWSDEMVNCNSDTPRDQREDRKARQDAGPASLVLWNIVPSVLNGQLSGRNQEKGEPTHEDDDWKEEVH